MVDPAALIGLAISVLGAAVYLGRKLQQIEENQKDFAEAVKLINEHCHRLYAIEQHLGFKGWRDE